MRKALMLLLFLLLSLAPWPGWAAIYYVAQSGGSNSNSCTAAQSPSTARATINAGAQCLSAGDTLSVGPGTYVEILLAGALPSGSPGTPTVLKSEPALGAIMRPTYATWVSAGSPSNSCIITTVDQSYITIDGMTLDMANWSGFPTGIHGMSTGYCAQGFSANITFQNNDVGNVTLTDPAFFPTGIFCSRDSSSGLYYKNHIHHIGTYPANMNSYYGFYCTGHDNVLDNNHVHHTGKYGMHNYDSLGGITGQVVKNNYIHDTQNSCILIGGSANAQVFNNICGAPAGTDATWSGIYVGYTSTNVGVYHNTIYQCLGYGVGLRNGESTGTRVQNNIVYGCGNGTLTENGGQAAVLSNNLFTNPGFVNAAAGDFHLSAGTSPAVNAGVTLAAVPRDRDNLVRPQPPSANAAIGAYEFPSGGAIVPSVGPFYVSPTGDDTRNCTEAKSIGTPKKTLADVCSCMAAGATLYLRAGIYTETFGACPLLGGTGESSRTLISAWSGESVTIRTPSASTDIVYLTNPTNHQYITFHGLIFDGNNLATTSGFSLDAGVHHIRFEDGEILNAHWLIWLRGANNVEILRSKVHNNITALDAVMLLGTMDGTRVEGNEISASQRSGLSMDATGTFSNTTLRANRFYNHAVPGTVAAAVKGTTLLASNNLFYSNQAGLQVQTGTTNAKVYNNTFHNLTASSVAVNSGASGTAVTNNIVSSSPAMTNAGTGTTFSANLCTTSGTGCGLVGDPLFTSPASGNFDLQAGSPALETGVTLAEVPNDVLGRTRPQPSTGNYDIGAYESLVTPGPPPVLVCQPGGIIVCPPLNTQMFMLPR